MNRRAFTQLLAGAALSPLIARAQQSETRVVGFLCSRSQADAPQIARPFLQGLAETGYSEGKNVKIEYRWAENRFERLSELAVNLAQQRVSVIAALAAAAPGLAAKAATSTIPIVFQTGSDPVQDGLVASMNRPGGNVTGVTRLAVNLGPKRLELLLELVPQAKVIAVLVDPSNRIADVQVEELHKPVQQRGLKLLVAKATTDSEIQRAIAGVVQQGADVLVVVNQFFPSRRQQVLALVARHGLPASYTDRADVIAGGLMSYGASLGDSFRQAGVYVGRILKGDKPAAMPVQQPTKFDLVINLKTARALGIAVPPALIVRADEVIE